MSDAAVDHLKFPSNITESIDLNVGLKLDVDLSVNFVLHLIQCGQDQIDGGIAQLCVLQNLPHFLCVIKLVHTIIHLHQIRLDYDK